MNTSSEQRVARADSPFSTFQHLSFLLAQTQDHDDHLTGLAVALARAAGPDVECSISLPDAERLETVAASADWAAEVTHAQYDLATGPCRTAQRERREVIVLDLPQLADEATGMPAATAAGVRCLVAVPFTTLETATGVANLYSQQPNAFPAAVLASIRLETATLGMALAIARKLDEQRRLQSDLQAAMRSRSVIDQAIGLLMGRNGCSADDAFAALRRASQREHRKLRAVAADLVSRQGGPAVEA